MNSLIIFQIIIIIILISISSFILTENVHHYHFANWSTIRRQRRGLIFNEGGTAKFIGGAIYPLYLEDKVHWRQVNCLYNFQTQYTAPDKPLYWWNKWNTFNGRSFISENFINNSKNFNKRNEKNNKYPSEIMPDNSRKFVYLALENFMNLKSLNGRQCLLRGICENGQIIEHIGIFAEFMHVLLKPGKEDIDTEYKNAYDAGKAGANCLSLYSECPHGDSFLDSLTVTF